MRFSFSGCRSAKLTFSAERAQDVIYVNLSAELSAANAEIGRLTVSQGSDKNHSQREAPSAAAPDAAAAARFPLAP